MSKKKDNAKDLESVKKSHVESLFRDALELRESNPKKAIKLFEEVLKYEPTMHEARLKISFLLLKMNNFKYDYESLLMPVVDDDNTTLDMKQRAYTNLSCSISFNPKDSRYKVSEDYAQKGIDLDLVGTHRLWENLGNSMRRQGKLDAAQRAYQKAVDLNPDSKNAFQRKESIMRFLDPAKARAEAATNPLDKMLAQRDFKKPEDTHPRSNSPANPVQDISSPTWISHKDEQDYTGATTGQEDTLPIADMFLIDEKPLPKDRPVVVMGTQALVLEQGTTLGDLRKSHGKCHLLEYQHTEIAYYRDAHVLGVGSIYELVLDANGPGLDTQEASILLRRMEKHLQRMAKSAVRSEKSINIGKISIPVIGRDKEEDEDDEVSTTPSSSSTNIMPSTFGRNTIGTIRTASPSPSTERRQTPPSGSEKPSLDAIFEAPKKDPAENPLLPTSVAVENDDVTAGRKGSKAHGASFTKVLQNTLITGGSPNKVEDRKSRDRRVSASLISDARLYAWGQATALNFYLTTDQSLLFHVRRFLSEGEGSKPDLNNLEFYVEAHTVVRAILDHVGTPLDSLKRLIDLFLKEGAEMPIGVDRAVKSTLIQAITAATAATLDPSILAPAVNAVRDSVVGKFREWQSTATMLKAGRNAKNLWNSPEAFPLVLTHDDALFDALAKFLADKAPQMSYFLDFFGIARAISGMNPFMQEDIRARALDLLESTKKARAEGAFDKSLFDDTEFAAVTKALKDDKFISPNIFQTLLANANAELAKAMNEFQMTQPGGQGIFKRLGLGKQLHARRDSQGEVAVNSSTESDGVFTMDTL